METKNNLQVEYKALFNLFRLLSEPANKRDRESWKQAMHVFRHRKEDHDYRAVRQEFIYPQLLRVLLKSNKAESLHEAFKRAVESRDIWKLQNYGVLQSGTKLLGIYKSFGLPAFLAEKADQDDEFIEMHEFESGHTADFKGGDNSNAWIWKNLGLDIVRALSSTCTRENLDTYCEKYNRKRVNFLIKTLVEIADKFAGLKNSTQLIKKFQAGEIKPKNYSSKKLRRYKFKELDITYSEQQSRARARKLRANGISEIYWEEIEILPATKGTDFLNNRIEGRRKVIVYLDGRIEKTNTVKIWKELKAEYRLKEIEALNLNIIWKK